ncbi:MAG: 2-oxoglutarate dehydrogenase E1 component [Waddliaceae bacterium]
MDVNPFLTIDFGNLDFLEEMQKTYRENSGAVAPSWRSFFDQLEVYQPMSLGDARSHLIDTAQLEGKRMRGLSEEGVVSIGRAESAGLRVYHLIQAYRTYGHLMADINPIATHPVEEPWQLRLETLGFHTEELLQPFPSNGLFEEPAQPLQNIIEVLKDIYCRKIGVEYMGIQDPQLEQWLQQHIEPNRFKIDLNIEQKKMILQHLNKSELFESFLHTKYVGQKRFSLEGGETLIPILAAVIETGSGLGLEEFVIGMAHRGRLNVLSNILNKSYSQVFSEFEEGHIPLTFEGSGDVKYHKGFSSVIQTHGGSSVNVILNPNPSHLEAVDPVVQGRVVARQVKKDDISRKERIVPILVHGDAAIAGQGVVYETLQMYRLKGYSAGGTIHIVINNQIGFTTLPKDYLSTHYCSDIARTFCAPVFHVNAEDPEGCVHATNLAVKLRQKFHCDVFIDLNCYRKYGHNEADEPAFTQPLEYQLIRQKKPIREIYRDDLIHQGILERQMAEALEVEFKEALQAALSGAKLDKRVPGKLPTEAEKKESDFFAPIETGVAKEVLKEAAERFCHIPEGFTIHPKLQRLIQHRLAMALEDKPIDWGMGETLAYASLLREGIHVRLSGQDTCRGTFSHRHALWMDQVAERAYYPLKHLKRGQGRFDVYNSPLSEYAVLGFEYGYSLGFPEALVIWEAQFGDFSNGAQVIIDQFITTGEQKWGQKNGVVLFLPHGYEGQGPEHSSARIERFLALSGNNNIQVVYPTLPAQLFHLLRRQVLKPMDKPLVVFTPKGLLRHHDCCSALEDFTVGSFQEVIDDSVPPNDVKRVVFCSGRIFFDLSEERKRKKVRDLAIVRIEQIYPLDEKKMQSIIKKYQHAGQWFWVQEEPENMGAWEFIRHHLRKLLPGRLRPVYIGRERSASTAAGSLALHKREHGELLLGLFGEDDETRD